MSRTGCYLDMLTPLPQGAKILVRLHNEEETFESAATVIYVSPGLGMGVAFASNLEANQQVVLDRWLAAAVKTSL